LGISEGYFVAVVRTGAVSYFKNDDGDTVRGKYGIEAIAAFVKWALDKRRSDTPASRFEEAKTARMETLSTTGKLQLLMLKGKVASIADIEQSWANATIPLRNSLLGLPSYVARQLEEKSADQIVKILTEHVDRIWSSCRPPSVEEVLSYNKKLLPSAIVAEAEEDVSNGDSEKDLNGDADA
jgi:hypothetical protein